MCLGIPGRVLSVEGAEATVDFWGVTRRVRLELCDEPVAPGDYVLNHVGYAIRRIPDAEVQGTLDLYDELLRVAGDDLMAGDVRNELSATKPTGGSS